MGLTVLQMTTIKCQPTQPASSVKLLNALTKSAFIIALCVMVRMTVEMAVTKLITAVSISNV